jgi:hypothetical protein
MLRERDGFHEVTLGGRHHPDGKDGFHTVEGGT